jgi:ribosomal-protein-alanine N-acetyltransferase
MTFAMPRLVGDGFELRLAVPSDVPQLLAYRRENAEHFEPFEPVRSADHFTEAYWERQVAIGLEEFASGQSVKMYIFEPGPDGEVVGLASFSNIVRGPFQSCFVGYALGERHQGRGVMTAALRLGIDYMFNEQRLHRIAANYLPHNTRSAAVLRRLGFTVDGYARDYLLIEGRWQDHILTSLVNPAWEPPTA